MHCQVMRERSILTLFTQATIYVTCMIKNWGQEDYYIIINVIFSTESIKLVKQP